MIDTDVERGTFFAVEQETKGVEDEFFLGPLTAVVFERGKMPRFYRAPAHLSDTAFVRQVKIKLGYASESDYF